MFSQNAVTLCRDLQRGSLSAEEVMQETYRRIETLNPQLNALVNLLSREEAIKLAQAADRVPIAERGMLHGLPMATKDAVETRGFPTTWGFKPWYNKLADKDDAQATRLRRAGAIFIGHTNMPEFGLGSHTFNNLFGHTKNPYDLQKTPGGSSGGAAVALASSFCNVVGFRPSIGRVPNNPGMAWLARLSTTGPMARTVADTALLFAVQAGPYAPDPLTLAEPGETFLDAWTPMAKLNNCKIAYSPNLHGLPVQSEVANVIHQAADMFANLGARVTETAPDLSQAMDVFHIQRAASLAHLGNTLDATTPDWKQHAKETAVWNIEKGQQLSGQEILSSDLTRSKIYAQVAEFFEHYDALILPAAQVAPFDSNIEWIQEINGKAMDTYIDWMTVCCVITVTGLPAISLPAGFTPSGLPVGVQIVGKPRGDLALLQLAHAFERATNHHSRKPGLCAV